MLNFVALEEGAFFPAYLNGFRINSAPVTAKGNHRHTRLCRSLAVIAVDREQSSVSDVSGVSRRCPEVLTYQQVFWRRLWAHQSSRSCLLGVTSVNLPALILCSNVDAQYLKGVLQIFS
ncbi:hypothetical protein AcV7_004515 [Taiwanofungus camphoratus]|nr:hypothetical protein AcV7_004515 [Antrodia cinnamomea]